MCTFPDPFVHIPLVYTCTWMLLGPPASSAALLIALLISFLIKGRLSVRRVCCLPRQKGGVEGGADRIHLLLRIFRPWFMALFSFSKSRERHKHVSSSWSVCWAFLKHTGVVCWAVDRLMFAGFTNANTVYRATSTVIPEYEYCCYYGTKRRSE